MKMVIPFFVALSVSLSCGAQVQIKDLPSRGYEQRIKDFVNNMTVIDTHEHLFSVPRLKRSVSLDFMLLLFNYSNIDIIDAGLPRPLYLKLLKDSMPVMEKWKIIKPFWERTNNTAYNRTSLLAADKLYGIKDINDSTVELLSQKIREAYQTDWMKYVLKDKCRIEYIILANDDRNINVEGISHSPNFDNFVLLNSKKKILAIAKQQNTSIATLDDLVKALGTAFSDAEKKGIVGIKSLLAYQRIINYENTGRETAVKIFEKLMNSPDDASFSFEELKPLQDYMMHRVLDLGRDNGYPVLIHTGLQASNDNIIENSKPTHLVNLFREYPTVNFILYHGGYPFGGETATLAKYFPNVYIDMCWLYLIYPSFSERYLYEWLETVPVSKIMGFGGDYQCVDLVYAHLLQAKQIISKVLAEKVGDGHFTEEEAKLYARMILHDNAMRLYKF